MGLDHYIEAEFYVSGGWQHVAAEHPHLAEQYRQIVGALGLTPGEDLAPGGIFVRVRPIVWRKINAAHGWVIDHCWAPDKDDNCVPIPMSREDLTGLRDAARLAAEFYRDGKKDDAALAFPPMRGFFFGSYEVDDWFLRDCEEVDGDLTKLLENPKFATEDWSFSYYAWY